MSKFSPAAGYKHPNCCWFTTGNNPEFEWESISVRYIFWEFQLTFSKNIFEKKSKSLVSLKTPKMRFLRKRFWINSLPCFRPFENKGGVNPRTSVFFKQEKLLKNGFLSNFRREAAKSLSNFLSNSSKKNRFLNIFLSNFWPKKVKYVFKQFWWLFLLSIFLSNFRREAAKKNSTFLSNFRREAPKNENSLKTTGKFVKNMSF